MTSVDRRNPRAQNELDEALQVFFFIYLLHKDLDSVLGQVIIDLIT
jgi:hypothetical protein